MYSPVEERRVRSLEIGRLKSVASSYRRFWWLIVVGALLGAVGGLAASAIETPEFESSATLYVTSNGEATAQSAYQGALASEQRVASYAELARSNVVLTRAVEISGLDVSVEKAQSSVSALAVPDTVLVRVKARGDSPYQSAALANAVSSAMVEFAGELEQTGGGGPPLARLTVISTASQPVAPVTPRTERNMLLGAIVGICVACIGIFARDRFDTRLRSASDLAGFAQPVLGEIPIDSALGSSGVVDFQLGSAGVSEAYRKLRTSLAFTSVEVSGCKVVVVTSPESGEGKTTTCINLSLALAETGNRVVLVDGDLRRPSASLIFGLSQTVGFSTYLRGGCTLPDVLQSTSYDGLSFIASGESAPNPSELLGGARAADAIAELRASFDFVIIDTPPVLPVTDASVMSAYADIILVVVRSGSTSVAALERAVAEIEVGPQSVSGIVFNEVDEKLMKYEYYGNREDIVGKV